MLCAYLAGSINFAIVSFKLMGKQDPRAHHSGNPGVTNVYRIAGWPMAVFVLVLDVGRAAGVALLALQFWPEAWVPWAAFGLLMGNHFPCFHGFKGGKGVANYLGFCVVTVPVGTSLAVVAYGIGFAISRVPFLGSFAMVAVLTLFGALRWHGMWIGRAAIFVVAVMILWFHRANIAGLVAKHRRKDGY